jgi:thioredoxin-dependent peroxiredoxin
MNSVATLPALKFESTQGTQAFTAYQGKQNLVIYLMREFSCAMCQAHVRRLKAIYQELQKSGSQVLVIGGGSLEQAKTLERQLQLPFPVLADTERQSYTAFGLDKILGLWQKSGTVVADMSGKIKLVHGTGNPGAGLLEPEIRRVLGI